MTFDEWIKYGWDKGYCSVPVCSTHDGVPTTATEDEDWENGDDACLHVVRLYEDIAHGKAVSANSFAVQMRERELGWS